MEPHDLAFRAFDTTNQEILMTGDPDTDASALMTGGYTRITCDCGSVARYSEIRQEYECGRGHRWLEVRGGFRQIA